MLQTRLLLIAARFPNKRYFRSHPAKSAKLNEANDVAGELSIDEIILRLKTELYLVEEKNQRKLSLDAK